jgi:hypothetical protein
MINILVKSFSLSTPFSFAESFQQVINMDLLSGSNFVIAAMASL